MGGCERFVKTGKVFLQSEQFALGCHETMLGTSLTNQDSLGVGHGIFQFQPDTAALFDRYGNRDHIRETAAVFLLAGNGDHR